MENVRIRIQVNMPKDEAETMLNWLVANNYLICFKRLEKDNNSI